MTFKKLSAEDLRQHKGTSYVGVATIFFVHDGHGRILLNKRSQKCRDEQGRWEIAGGGLKWGMAAKDNLERELMEEFNAKAQKIEFMGYRDAFRTLDDGTPTHWITLDFAVLVDPAEVRLNEPDMSDAIGWFTLDKLPSPRHSLMGQFLKQYQKDIRRILKTD